MVSHILRASVALAAVISFSNGCGHLAAPAVAPSMPSSPTTITHEVVQLELEGDPRLPQSLEALDALIAEARANLKLLPTPPNEQGRAIQLFETMDTLLIRHNYVFPPTGLVDYVSDIFIDRHPTSDEVGKIELKGSNQRRRARIEAALKAGEAFHYVDCDTGAMLYIAVAEELGYPCRLIEIPGHNFLRWDSPSLKLNWDANTGESLQDDVYQDRAALKAVELPSLPYLRSMTHDQVIGYWHALRGRVYERQKRYVDALHDFQDAVTLAPGSPDNINELAWLLASCPDGDLRDGASAITWVRRALAMRTDPNWLDTLAAAYAEVHHWDLAVTTEQKAKDLAVQFQRSEYLTDPPPDFDRYIGVYSRHQTYAEYQVEHGGGMPVTPTTLPLEGGNTHVKP